MSGMIGKDFKYNFKFTTTPPKGPDYEETKALMNEWVDRGTTDLRTNEFRVTKMFPTEEEISIFMSVQSARATDKLVSARPQLLVLNKFCCEHAQRANLRQPPEL
jgi:hypothetical protein